MAYLKVNSSNHSLTSFPAGHILQVQSTTLTTAYDETTTTGWKDIAGLSVSITPSSSSNKIWLSASITASASNDCFMRFMRDTAIGVGTGASGSQLANTFGYIYSGSGTANWPRAMNFLDSPASTSAIAYHIEFNSSATIYVNYGSGDTDSSAHGRAISTITAMEVVA